MSLGGIKRHLGSEVWAAETQSRIFVSTARATRPQNALMALPPHDRHTLALTHTPYFSYVLFQIYNIHPPSVIFFDIRLLRYGLTPRLEKRKNGQKTQKTSATQSDSSLTIESSAELLYELATHLYKKMIHRKLILGRLNG